MTLDTPIDEAQKKERDLFLKLVVGDQSKAQRHIFFAEREANKVPGIGKDTQPREIKRAAVIGAGTMGGGISMNFVNVGIPVTIIETSEEALKKGMATIEKNYQMSVQRGSLKPEDLPKRMALFTPTTDLNALKDADIVIEAVFENMPIKKELFAKLDKIAKNGAVLATNTSYLNVDEIASVTSRVPDVLGMHFFSPANVMKLLEIVRGKDTAPDVLATAMAVGQGDPQGAGGGRRVPRLRRQPHAVRARHRGREAAARRRAAAGRRRRAHRVRLPDGPVRDERSRRHRRRLALAQGARRARRDRGLARRAGPLRPEDRQGLLSL